jgi:hypothetical protein
MKLMDWHRLIPAGGSPPPTGVKTTTRHTTHKAAPRDAAIQEPTMNTLRKTLVVTLLAASGLLSLPATAGVSIGVDIRLPGVSIDINGAPPPPRFEPWPGERRGYVWHPGYWRWDGRAYAWIGGVWMRERPGYVWVPERWEPTGSDWYFRAGRWEANRDWREAQIRERNRWEDWRRSDMRREAEWRREKEHRDNRMDRRDDRRDDRQDNRQDRRDDRQDNRQDNRADRRDDRNPGRGNGPQPQGHDRHER